MKIILVAAVALLAVSCSGLKPAQKAQLELSSTETIFPLGIDTNSVDGISCPNGHFIAHAVYARTIAQGWGWAPDTNVTVHSATYTNQPNVVVQFVGKNGDVGCGSPTATTGNPASSPKYRFAIYWPTGSTVPTRTNDCPMTLTGFLP